MSVIEQKTIGINISLSGTFSNTEIYNNNLQLKEESRVGSNVIYTRTGYWISDVVDIGDNFKEFGKIVVDNINPQANKITIRTRTSDDSVNFNQWLEISSNNDILSEKNRFIQVQVNLEAELTDKDSSLIEINTSDDFNFLIPKGNLNENNISLKNTLQYPMNTITTIDDNTSIKTGVINTGEWKFINGLTLNNSKSLILDTDGYYKKWISPTYSYDVINPNMTSNSSNGYVVTGDVANGTYPLWYIFDGNPSTYYRKNTISNVAIITLQLPESIMLGKFSVTPYTGIYYTSIIISGSADGVVWNDIYTINQNSLEEAGTEYIINDRGLYKYLRFNFTKTSSGGSYVSINQINISKLIITDEGLRWDNITSTTPSAELLENSGMDSLAEITPYTINYTQQLTLDDSQSSYNIFKKSININDLSKINKIEVGV